MAEKRAPFEQLYSTIQQLKTQPGATPEALDSVIQQAGYEPDDYIAMAKNVKAGRMPTSGGILPDSAQAFGRGFTDVATFGTSDEIGALLDAGIGHLSGKGEFSDLYKRALENRRGAIEDASKAHPRAFFGGSVAGGLSSAMAAPEALSFGLPEATSLSGSVLRGAAHGAIGGGLFGFGSGEGDLASRAKSGANNLILGGVLGAAAGPVGYGLQRAGEALAGAANVPLVGENGGLSEQAQEIAQKARIDTRAVTPDVVADVAKKLQGKLATEETIPAAIRSVIADRIGVPLAAGQATGAGNALTAATAGVAPSPGAAGPIQAFLGRQGKALTEAGINAATPVEEAQLATVQAATQPSPAALHAHMQQQARTELFRRIVDAVMHRGSGAIGWHMGGPLGGLVGQGIGHVGSTALDASRDVAAAAAALDLTNGYDAPDLWQPPDLGALSGEVGAIAAAAKKRDLLGRVEGERR